VKVLWTGAVFDLSGYGVASREYVRALDAVGVDVAVEARSFESWKPPGLVDEIVDDRLRQMTLKERGARAHVIHLTPDNLRDYRRSDRARICYFAWETSLLPPEWVPLLNEVPVEIWVPCAYMVDVCRRSGITAPVTVVPHAIPLLSDDWQPAHTIKLPEDKFKFYSVFQWSERKNPVGLITAYYQEFRKSDPVCLVLKTYLNTANHKEKRMIREEIARLKLSIRGDDAPSVMLVDDLVGSAAMLAIHRNCSCYVTMTRSEGFCIPAFEAAAMGNPVIVPNYSAFPDHLDDGNSFLIDVPREVPVRNMGHISKMYTEDMLWGDPSVEDCRRLMRQVFEDQAAAKTKGLAARQYVGRALSHTTIGTIIKNRLGEIVTAEGSERR